MTTIVIGTTPTIQFKFKAIAPSDLAQAKLTIERNNMVIITKTLAEATVSEDTIAWTLSQSETLLIGVGQRDIMLNWLTANGTRGTSAETKINFITNHIRAVMS
jgi:orotate phosphoribosyltransferase-like protein